MSYHSLVWDFRKLLANPHSLTLWWLVPTRSITGHTIASDLQSTAYYGPQEMLERLEFFPISCRVHRALENFKQQQALLSRDAGFWRHGAGGKRRPGGGLSTKVD